MDAPSLEVFKARLDVASGSLVWWLATLHITGGLKPDHCGPFQPRPFCEHADFLTYPTVNIRIKKEKKKKKKQQSNSIVSKNYLLLLLTITIINRD